MAYQNKVISNSVTGQSIRFIKTAKDTDGELLEMEATFRGGSKAPPPHYHPYQEEHFEILEGEVTIRMNEKLTVLKKGDTLRVPPCTTHSMWNNSEKRAVISWKVQPALDAEYLFETFTGLANDGKTNHAGVPSFLQAVLTIRKYNRVFRLTKPSYKVQQIVFSILTPISYFMGYKPDYAKYID